MNNRRRDALDGADYRFGIGVKKLVITVRRGDRRGFTALVPHPLEIHRPHVGAAAE
jgi:hypothetical protein